MASDGRWYPPNTAAGVSQPAYWQPPRQRGHGCLGAVLGAVGAVVALVVIAVVLVAHAGTPGQGTPSHPAAADVSVTACGVDPTVRLPEATVEVHNHSSGTSNYTYSVSFINAAGTVVSQGGGLEAGIVAGETADEKVYGDTSATSPLTCKLVDVVRLAAP